MAKSRSFSIYLLKDGFSSENALNEENSLGESIEASFLPKGATLYIQDNVPKPPWWKSFWGIDKDLIQSLKGAIVFLPVKDRCFALTFGHAYHNLKDYCYEYDFGLRTTLNAIDPDQIKSTDLLQPENAKRQRIQSPKSSDLTFFDFNKDESIIKKLTGGLKSEYKEILSHITGSSNVRVGSKVAADEIVTLCEHLMEIYGKEDFKTSFPDILNITPIKDPALLSKLNEKLLTAFQQDSIELVFAIPEIIDYSESYKISYSGAGASTKGYDAVYIQHYRDFLKSTEIKSVDVENLKKHKVNIEDENGHKKQQFSVYKCFLFDCELDSEHYHLCDGDWYKIDKDYIGKLRKNLDSCFYDHDILFECDEKREDGYNKWVTENNVGYVCLDKTSISPKGQKAIEPCDLYTVDGDKANLIHIKISTRSSTLSHLFNQGINSVELIRMENEAKLNLKNLLNNDKNLISPIDADKFKVIYGIITAKNKNNKSDNLPIFSRISLLRTINSLKLMGVDVSVVYIKDNVNRKSENNSSTKGVIHD